MSKKNFFSLKLSPPFDRLGDAELTLLANLAVEKHFEPQSTVFRAGQPLKHLYITVRGQLVIHPSEEQVINLPKIFGYESLLFNRAIAHDIVAEMTEGASCLLFKRENFFTIAYECPDLILGFCQSPQTIQPSVLFIS